MVCVGGGGGGLYTIMLQNPVPVCFNLQSGTCTLEQGKGCFQLISCPALAKIDSQYACYAHKYCGILCKTCTQQPFYTSYVSEPVCFNLQPGTCPGRGNGCQTLEKLTFSMLTMQTAPTSGHLLSQTETLLSSLQSSLHTSEVYIGMIRT